MGSGYVWFPVNGKGNGEGKNRIKAVIHRIDNGFDEK